MTKLDRLACSVADLVKIVESLTKKGVALRILAMGLETGTPTGRLMLNVIGSVAQFEREVMLERQREGVAKAKAEGQIQRTRADSKSFMQDALYFDASCIGWGLAMSEEFWRGFWEGVARTTLIVGTASASAFMVAAILRELSR